MTSGSPGGEALASPSGMFRRNVATSMVLFPNLMCASRKRRPMIQQFRNSFLICPGCASVPMSKSFGRRPEHQIADAAPDQVSDVIILLQAVEDAQRL
jgi:hypothetical protein